jgi:predicted AAA+ superfamily ATPase
MKTALIERRGYVDRVRKALNRSAIVAIMGPRQCGKTTLARMIFETDPDQRTGAYFDLENQVDLRRLSNPEMVLGSLSGLVVIDEIQTLPALFPALRVLADRRKPTSGPRTAERNSTFSSWPTACGTAWSVNSMKRRSPRSP